MKKLITALGLLIIVLIIGFGVLIYGVRENWFGTGSHLSTAGNDSQQETVVEEVEPEESLKEETISEEHDDFMDEIASMRSENDKGKDFVPDVVVDSDSGTVTVGNEEQTDVASESDGETVLEVDALKEVCNGTNIEIPDTKEDTVTVEELAEANGMDTSEKKDGTVVLSDTYQTSRIVVNSEDEVTDENAISVAGPFNNTYVLQYENENAAEKACELLGQDPDVNYAEPEQLCFLDPPDSDGVEAYNEAEQDSAILESEAESMAETATGADNFVDEDLFDSEASDNGNDSTDQAESDQSIIGDQDGTSDEAASGSQDGTSDEAASGSQDGTSDEAASGSQDGTSDEASSGSRDGTSDEAASGSQDGTEDLATAGEQSSDDQTDSALTDSDTASTQSDSDDNTAGVSTAQSSMFSYKNFDTWGSDVVGLSHMKTLTKSVYGSYAKAPVVKVAVIDSGIDYNHPWFKNRLLSKGYDFVNNDNNATDDYMHGTVVSGVIARYTSTNVKILPLKAGDSNGSLSDIDVYNAIEYAIKKKVDIINMSFGRIDSYGGELLEQAVTDARNAGIILIAAYGNDGKKTTSYIPACYRNVVGVSSINIYKQKSDFSNYGKYVDMTAPGEDVFTAYPTYMSSSEYPYAYMNGTSLSAPFVSAACAMIKTLYPKNNASQIKYRLYNNAAQMKNTTYYGHGLLYLKKFTVKTAATTN